MWHTNEFYMFALGWMVFISLPSFVIMKKLEVWMWLVFSYKPNSTAFEMQCTWQTIEVINIERTTSDTHYRRWNERRYNERATEREKGCEAQNKESKYELARRTKKTSQEYTRNWASPNKFFFGKIINYAVCYKKLVTELNRLAERVWDGRLNEINFDWSQFGMALLKHN